MAATATKIPNPYAESAERFGRDTARHQMTVLHDDGLYRHLRFKPPGRSFYWFDLVTWPGHLAFVGDGQGFVFARTEDMFPFFRNSAGYGINPVYWSEKLTAGRDMAESYSVERFNERVAEALADAEETYPGVTAAWAQHVEDLHNTDYEITAREALEDFRFVLDNAPKGQRPFEFRDTWEWSLKDWDRWFLWACHAIVWGVAQYDAAKAEQPAEAVSGV